MCLKVTDCPSARNALRSGRSHGLVRCGFDRYIEIVCCPQHDPPKATTSKHTPNSREMWTEEPSTTKSTPRTRQTTATPSARRPTRTPDKDDVQARNPKRKSEQGKNKNICSEDAAKIRDQKSHLKTSCFYLFNMMSFNALCLTFNANSQSVKNVCLGLQITRQRLMCCRKSLSLLFKCILNFLTNGTLMILNSKIRAG